ncbi:hypothetical protein [Laspinema olomoucense]|uniref:hypothetical protein n=1 Tax=Laspinema olomoucense TaxID=3231600 RepID=UPI0021BB694E|nr:hypothetical protein [Laspinema sp. D3d]MCT7975223.1 hypothetical protein [Laspinema sp. D3d]
MKYLFLAILIILGWSLPTSSQSDAVRPLEPAIEESAAPGGEIKMRRHRVNLSVSSLDDVKVREGDQVQKGDLLSDRTEQRLALESQREALNMAIEQARKPLPPLAPLPEPDFSRQEIAIAEAKANLEMLEQIPLPQKRFRPINLQEVGDYQALKASTDLQQQKIQGAINLQMAVADLSTARNQYQQSLYEHSIQQQRVAESQQRQQYQLGLLLQQAAEVEDKLALLAVVRSPVDGDVRRVKVTNQTDRILNIEVTIDPDRDEQETTADN